MEKFNFFNIRSTYSVSICINKNFPTPSFIWSKCSRPALCALRCNKKLMLQSSGYYRLTNQNIGAREVLKCSFLCILLRYKVAFLHRF